jgi:hypothetical protein
MRATSFYRSTFSVAAVATVLFCGLATAQTRDTMPPADGTASIAGIVVGDGDSQPIRRAIVTIGVPGDSRRQWTTTTDGEGRFSVTGLPAATFTITATKPAYLTTAFGARRPGSTVGVPVAVRDAQRLTGVTLRMTRGGVITGVVRDTRGQPMQGVPVRLSRLVSSAGAERRLVMASGVATLAGGTTDDRGRYRFYGVPPGDYVVSAQPALARTLPGLPSFVELRAPSAEELRWADRALQTAASAGPPREAASPPPLGQGVAFATVFHPATVDATVASVVAVAAGQERDGIDLSMQLVRTARLTGTVTDAAGQPGIGVQLTLIPKAPVIDEARRQAQIEVGLTAASDFVQRSAANGGFSFSAVPPGAYTLMARATASGLRVGGTTPQALWGMTDVDVNGVDVDGVAIVLSPASNVSGTVRFEGAADVPGRATVRLVPVPSGVAMATPQIPAPGSEFLISGAVPGQYRFTAAAIGATAAARSPWALKSVVIAGRDVSDSAFEIQPGQDLADVAITLSDSMASVVGVVSDGGGRPSSDLSLILFSVDRAQWFQQSRRLRPPARAASDGRFEFTGLPAGAYYLAALTDFEADDWFDPVFLDQIVPAAIRVTVKDGEKKTQGITVK